MPITGKPVLSKNNIEIYKADSRDACIHYGQGYPFCISRPKNLIWQSYRDLHAATFYFVFDRNRSNEDPLHVVVVDMTDKGPLLTDANNTTGSIAEFGSDWQAYFDYLKSKGIDTSILQNIPHTPEEQEEVKILDRANSDLGWFKRLSYDLKSRYIGRGHYLTNEQFEYLLENKAYDLLHQYLTTGVPLPREQVKKIMDNNQLRNSYIDAQIAMFENEEHHFPHDFVVDSFNEKQKERFIAAISKYPSTSLDYATYLLERNQTVPYVLIQKIAEKGPHESQELATYFMKQNEPIPDILIKGIAKNPYAALHFALEFSNQKDVPKPIIDAILNNDMVFADYISNLIVNNNNITDYYMEKIYQTPIAAYAYATEVLENTDKKVPNKIVETIANSRFAMDYAHYLILNDLPIPKEIINVILKTPLNITNFLRLAKNKKIPKEIIDAASNNPSQIVKMLIRTPATISPEQYTNENIATIVSKDPLAANEYASFLIAVDLPVPQKIRNSASKIV